MDRAFLRAAPYGGAWRDQVVARSARTHEPGKDRRSVEDGRRVAVSLQARLSEPGHSVRDPAIACLPRCAPIAARLARVSNFLSGMLKGAIGFASRPLPRWRTDYFRDRGVAEGDAILLVDTFNRYFEPENARAA